MCLFYSRSDHLKKREIKASILLLVSIDFFFCKWFSRSIHNNWEYSDTIVAFISYTWELLESNRSYWISIFIPLYSHVEIKQHWTSERNLKIVDGRQIGTTCLIVFKLVWTDFQTPSSFSAPPRKKSKAAFSFNSILFRKSFETKRDEERWGNLMYWLLQHASRAVYRIRKLHFRSRLQRLQDSSVSPCFNAERDIFNVLWGGPYGTA